MRYSNPETIVVEKLVNKWVKEYKSGHSAPWIADKYSVHHSTVYRRLKWSNTPMRTVGQVKLGKLNPNWRENPGYGAVHAWVSIRKPRPDLCQECGIRPAIDLANISNTYNPDTYTRDLGNWEWLCRKCHMIKDGRLERMYHGGPKVKYENCVVCKKTHKARGYCERHYQQFMRLGYTW